MIALALLLTLIATTDDPPPLRGHDPYVFRCTLDGKPRMLVIALSPGWWMALDTQTCRVHKVWEGDVDFTGPVYDTRHGPQPEARGDMVLKSTRLLLRDLKRGVSSVFDPELDWRGYWVFQPATIWRGYRFDRTGNVVLFFDVSASKGNGPLQNFRVELAPTFEPTGRRGGRLTVDVVCSDFPDDLELEMAFQPLERGAVSLVKGKRRSSQASKPFAVKARRGVTQWQIEFLP